MDPAIVRHIFDTADGLFAQLEPIERGITKAAFFNRGRDAFVVPSTEVRTVSVPLPEKLKEFYAKYPPTFEFTMKSSEWTFLSEQEIARLYDGMCTAGQARLVDFALQNLGMGHVETCAYDPVTNTVFTARDGGSNGWDRADNFKNKVSLDVNAQPRVSFEAWWQAETAHAKDRITSNAHLQNGS